MSRDEQVERNRRLVLEAARRVFLARGYASATVDAIAEEAGFRREWSTPSSTARRTCSWPCWKPGSVERAEQNEQLAEQLDGRQLAEAVPDLALSLLRAEPEWMQLVLEFRLHAARVPELNRRYAELHERTLDGLASVYARLHERAGTTPRYPVRVLAQLDDGGQPRRVPGASSPIPAGPTCPPPRLSASSCCRPCRPRPGDSRTAIDGGIRCLLSS